jgi:hypothetical protein
MTAPDWDAVYVPDADPRLLNSLNESLDDELGSIFIPGFTFLGRKLPVYIILYLKLLEKYYAARSSSLG